MKLLGLDIASLIIGLATLASFLTVLSLGLPLVRREDYSQRLRAVKARRAELREQQRAALEEKAGLSRRDDRRLIRALLQRLRIARFTHSEGLRLRLAQAGWRHRSAAVTYVFLRVAAPLGLGLLGALVLFGTDTYKIAPPQKLLIEMAVLLFGFFLPPILLTNKIQNRQISLTRSFPDALDLLLVCVEAGASLEAALQRVTEEIAEGAPEIAEEFGLTGAELAFLGDRRQALENLAQRTGIAPMRALVTTMIQAERYGTPLGSSLKVLAEESRTQRMIEAEKKANSLPAKLTVPMIACFMPVLFIVILGPAAIQVLALR